MNERKRNLMEEYTGRDPRVKPGCPFCGLPIERPAEQILRRPLEMPVGSCSCGAVYAYDATGHNLGTAFSEALVFACNMDWDLAWSLLPGEDYLEELVEKYDIESNYIIPVGAYEGRRISGALYFIRMHNDIQEVTRQGVQKKLDRARSVAAAPQTDTIKQKRKKKIDKKEIEALVDSYRLEPLLDIAGYDKGIIRYLQRILYTGDELLRLKTADALGQVCAIIAQHDPSAVSRLLQRLLTSISNAGYGASTWGAIDAIGEIIAGSPDMFGGYVPVLLQFLEEEDLDLRPSILRALAVIAGERPDLITKTFSYFIKYAGMNEPQTRGNAVWLMGNLASATNPRPGASEAKAELNTITGDNRPVSIYAKGVLEKKSIGRLALLALEKLG
ncbi:DVU0298 family protein [Desulfoscipio sp. XC116]|uniref:DVU0298 family protein n=1 Tax=Desulfoscipio sp. XC116 TaxID=3144975 RepID=UPI00325AB6CF